MIPPELASLSRVKYLEGGRDPATGLDCWGFYREACRVLSLPVPPVHQVEGKEGEAAEWAKAAASPEWRRIIIPKPYCLVLLTRPGRNPHCGMVLPDLFTFVHLGAQGFRCDFLDCAQFRLARKEYFRYVP